jgi:hypothetical protein
MTEVPSARWHCKQIYIAFRIYLFVYLNRVTEHCIRLEEVTWFWRPCDRESLMCSLKYNQQDATFILFFIFVNAVHVSGGFFAHFQELKNWTHSIWYVPGLLTATASEKTARNMKSIDKNKE